jgi:hypothetical protein
MGFFNAVKRFFKGTRNAAAPLFKEAKRSVTRRRRAAAPTGISSAEKKARQERSNAWKVKQTKKEAVAAEKGKKLGREAISTDKFQRDFGASLSALKKGERVKAFKPASAKRGAIHTSKRLRSKSKSPSRSSVRRGSIRAKENDWEPFVMNRAEKKGAAPVQPAPTPKANKAYGRTEIERNLAELFGEQAKPVKPIPKLRPPPAGRTRKGRASSPKKRAPNPFNSPSRSKSGSNNANGADAFNIH